MDKLGRLNMFPRGKLNDDDEGALKIAIGLEKDVVKIVFGIQVAWIGLPKSEAIQFANTILSHANRLK